MLTFEGFRLNPSTPAYRQLKSWIADAIRNRQANPGMPLPSERELAEQLGLSRVTVRKALDELVADGLVTRRRGSGTYVSEPPQRIAQSLSRLYSFSEDMRVRGREPGTTWLSREVATASAEEARRLRIEPGAPVARLHRLRFADGEPIALEWTVSPLGLLADPQQVGASFYEALRAVGHVPVRASQHITAVTIGGQWSRMLKVREGHAALDIHRVAELADGTPVEWTHSIFRGDAYDFVVDLSFRE